MHMNRELSLLLLFAAVMGMIVSSSVSSYVVIASTEGGGGDESGGDEGGGSDESGGNEPEPETEPETEPEPEPEVEPEPEPEPVIEEKTPLPYCDTPEGEAAPACHDLLDYDEITGLYPCNDGTQVETPEECPDATKQLPLENTTTPITDDEELEELAKQLRLPYPFLNPLEDLQEVLDNTTDPGETLPKVKVNVTDPGIEEPGDNQTDPGDNQTNPEPEPCVEIGNTTCPDPDPLPDPGDNKTIIIKKIFKNINIFKNNENSHGHSNFPDIDIIGLSTKENGNSMMCLFDIDSDHIQCQEFGMDSERVNSDFWRIIETNHDKNYDNGNTGSEDIDDAIEDIKSQDFSELDDADNHDFGIDLGWVAINPQGDGVTCVTTDQSGKGKSLCEPFAISNEDVDGQITEGFEFSS